jgi:hypothetical protein
MGDSLRFLGSSLQVQRVKKPIDFFGDLHEDICVGRLDRSELKVGVVVAPSKPHSVELLELPVSDDSLLAKRSEQVFHLLGKWFPIYPQLLHLPSPCPAQPSNCEVPQGPGPEGLNLVPPFVVLVGENRRNRQSGGPPRVQGCLQ